MDPEELFRRIFGSQGFGGFGGFSNQRQDYEESMHGFAPASEVKKKKCSTLYFLSLFKKKSFISSCINSFFFCLQTYYKQLKYFNHGILNIFHNKL